MVDDIDKYADPDSLVDAIIERVGNKIVLALPLGLGKANHIANALTKRAQADSSIDLEIITALTLESPALDNDFKRRLLKPALTRLFGDYPALHYAELQRKGRLPNNIRVSEFFMLAGQWLSVASAQQNYIPANYTHALGFLLRRGVNVIAQLLAVDSAESDFSLSCNPDITSDLLKLRERGRCQFLFVGQANNELPFMEGQARIARHQVDMLLQSPATEFPLYSVPKRPVSLPAYAIGLHTAQLVRDGGTLQIGIGAIGDAVTQALLLRHKNPECFTQLVRQLNRPADTGLEEAGAFDAGLYGISEMFVDGFLRLWEAGILTRQVDGAVLHGGFFVDCHDFYARLRALSPIERKLFQMMPVSFTNDLYGDEDAKRLARCKATFVNSAMMVTLRGAVVSDALEDGRVVSGVGGQYNFAAQAFALDDARLIITLNATRVHKGETVSNIVFSYGHETLPWHLRDIVVTEYGVADLRGKTESEAIQAMLKIVDSRFQSGLLEQARKAGKIDPDWCLPMPYTQNNPELIVGALSGARAEKQLEAYPFGTDFTPIEQRLLVVLELISQCAHSHKALAVLAWQGFRNSALAQFEGDCLQRMALDKPHSAREYFQQQLLKGALLRSRDP
ncbi:MAG: acetyl-CoA hydrolase/transferase C-terminal domain-containing protein [Pseudohongiellaceae bacterium]